VGKAVLYRELGIVAGKLSGEKSCIVGLNDEKKNAQTMEYL
jgi:hypothetical protein